MEKYSIDISDIKAFTFRDTWKMMKEAHVLGYMQCAEEHGMLGFIDTDLNCMGIATTDEPDEG